MDKYPLSDSESPVAIKEETARNYLRGVRTSTQTLVNLAKVGPVDRIRIYNHKAALTQAIDKFPEIITNPVLLNKYAKDRYDRPALDVVAAINNVNTTAIALRQWIDDNTIKGPGGGEESATRNIKGEMVPLTFSTAELAQFVILGDALLANFI